MNVRMRLQAQVYHVDIVTMVHKLLDIVYSGEITREGTRNPSKMNTGMRMYDTRCFIYFH